MSSLHRLKLFCLAAALVLAGCATTGGDPSGALSAVIDDMRCELQAMQPRLVTFDTRAHA